jgi:hypothetical protein
MVPNRVILAKRLSQCLNAALPSGVHAKALDVYALVFMKMGVDTMKQDYFLFTGGLFPLLQYASMSVKVSTPLIPLTHSLTLMMMMRMMMDYLIVLFSPNSFNCSLIS